MDSLARNPISNANPSGGSSIYGQPGMGSDSQSLDIVNQIKNREMKDFQDKANFMADLSLRQQLRQRQMFPPEPSSTQGNNPTNDGSQGQPQNVVMAQDPNQLTGYQKADIGVRQQGQNLESQRLNQQGKLGQEAIDIKTQQEKLNQQKSDQINAQKQADMQRKITESEAKIKQAQDALADKTRNEKDQLQAHKDLAAAMEERHKLELAQKDAQFQKASDQHQEQIDALQKKVNQAGRTKTTTELNPDGTKKTVTTEKGDAADTVNVIGKDGKQYTIPKDKMNDMDSDGTPHWKPAGSDQSNNPGDENAAA